MAALFSAQASAQQAPPPPQVSVAKPLVREVVDTDDFIGRFQASEQVSVRSRVGGYLQNIDFQDGQLVKAGDNLFQVDQRPFDTALSEAKASLAVANSTLTYARAQFDRVDALVKSGSQSVSTLDDRRRELQSAEASVQGAEASVDRAKLDLVYSNITAPLSGRIDRHLISVGNLVQADQTILTTIVALDPIDLYFDVDERRLLSYAETARTQGKVLQEGGGGIAVTVTLSDRDHTKFTGKVNFAENVVDPATGTLRVRARFSNPDFILQPGLFGRVSIEGSNPYKAILIPDEAISSDQNERIVYVLSADGTVTTKAVRSGPKLYGYRVIRTGLTGDENVVVKGVVRVRPGAKVTPVTVVLPQENNEAPSSSQEAAAATETTK
ncbi:efflux RND transporter periplasmic adaptor subunit [Rhizobium calliandrae]|uniref:Efflux RND transporter periplasmic adaptor subunit n=2 Tax=Rhizobium calliandrae TaxID=1312182 RepID=A0ABT7KG10_9HYPH|nr:efflux RND transporter periplasmic adaptor subunit [Rhizobium calliandrae]MDL2406955.1 efflux RND transporter periplasmic adaptor subunit [Rhizobium calliandrae]